MQVPIRDGLVHLLVLLDALLEVIQGLEPPSLTRYIDHVLLLLVRNPRNLLVGQMCIHSTYL